jgi:small Trp-rich protein
MLFVMLGVLLVALKLLEISLPGSWSWWLVLSPFAAALVWWKVADLTGYTQRQAMKAMDRKKAERRLQALGKLGGNTKSLERQARARGKD